ncbi:cellulose binding domain-containing protein [Streptomyces sp. VRA16 Mangrove soil]|uniref:glycoside hydrolase family 18 protein n=1 Tax=Streptomyces sp. VRA16 Mangrove soil TaxID=2817434 RepID=UPI001A9EE8CE|nr:cellulose binding domain-containing protein [Streptomyces sp. VRA16 Mangrove soil]MBO1334228.1 cellulose binding domain-containing protein [Streptomyces sp. VRA16 Mangrove soil]
MSSTHRRSKVSGRNKAIGGLVAAAVVGGGAFFFTSTASAASVGAEFSKTSSWTGGYTGQYVITNDTDKAQTGWTLEFDLPSGVKLSSLWNAESKTDGQHVTVTPASWDKEGIAAGKSVTVGFVASGDAAPTGCKINDTACSVDSGATPEPSGRPTESATPSPTASATKTAQPTATATSTATASPSTSSSSGTGSGSTASAGFAPYVDTSLYPKFDLVSSSKATGVKEYNLAFITSGGSCVPKWGGVTDLGSDEVAAQIGDLRAAGGDVRVSFGGASGTELAQACSSASDLAAAYQKVIDQYKLTKVDFDVEGGALPDTAANTERARAIATLQKNNAGLNVSFTLPVMPEGLTSDGVNFLKNAKENGVSTDLVNIMAMDYGASYSGDMGTYAEQAATATQAQIKSALGLSDTAAWKAVGITPMIGVNDVSSEIFKVDDATQLVSFAKNKGLGGLSMWSATRDKQCDGGAKNYADPTCSSIEQSANAFQKAFAAFN